MLYASDFVENVEPVRFVDLKSVGHITDGSGFQSLFQKNTPSLNKQELQLYRTILPERTETRETF
jgi:shikimate 5-dehydrogenase